MEIMIVELVCEEDYGLWASGLEPRNSNIVVPQCANSGPLLITLDQPLIFV